MKYQKISQLPKDTESIIKQAEAVVAEKKERNQSFRKINSRKKTINYSSN